MKLRIQVGVCALVAACVACALGCAPQQSPTPIPNSGTDSEPVQTVAWAFDADCSVCHATEASSTSQAGCLASVHTQQGNACTDCHNNESALAGVHGDTAGKTPASSLKSEIADGTCLACHESKEALAVKTAQVTIEDPNGTVVNPHALPDTKDHNELVCVDCHVVHKATVALEEAKSLCFSCHHAGVFECGTCHN